MSTQVNDEAQQLCQVIREVATDSDSVGATRRMLEGSGYDARLVEQLTTGLGLAGLTVPEEHDGVAAGLDVLLPVFGELGRALVAAPVLSSAVLATALLVRTTDDEIRKQWLPELAAGTATATVVVPSDRGDWVPARAAVRATRGADGTTVLDGACEHVLDGASADLLLLVADDGGAPALFAVEGRGAGVSREARTALDPSRPVARIGFEGAAARPLTTVTSLTDVLAEVQALGLLALAAESWGGAQRCLELAVEYAQQRHAFGRPIGGFQAIKHKLANLAIEVEYSRAAVARAATLGPDDPELGLVARIVAVQCTETFALAAQELIQVHGGIGFTWEHDAHLFSRRARANLLLLGRPRTHLDAVAAALLD